MKQPSRIFIAREEQSISGFEDRLNLLLGADVAGDSNLKPVVT